MKELYKLSIKEIRKLIINNDISVKEVCEYYINRIKKYGMKDGNNSVCMINPNYEKEIELLLNKGDVNLPLYGIPYLVKDNIDVYGMISSGGSMGFIDNYPKCDSYVVKRLRDNGAIILGKCNMQEMANYIGDIPDGYSSYGGIVKNSYNSDLAVGGSSSGSGSAMASCLCPFTLGTDTSYSVIACASMNGVYGFKPNNKRLNGSGVLPISKYFDGVGVFARRFSDLSVVVKSLMDDVSDVIEISSNVGIDECKNTSVSKEKEALVYNFVDKMLDYGFKFNELNNSYDNELYEIMKRDYGISLKEYLNNTNSKIRDMNDLVNFYHENKEYCKYGCSILEKALDFYNEGNKNIDRINVVMEKEEIDRLSFIEKIEEYDGVISLGWNTSIHFYHIPSISIPVYFDKELGIPKNIVIYSNDESKLLTLARCFSELIEEMPYPKYYCE